eukprot:TRINITY_DN4783_c0_g1_i4.p1 TRINITY_DN4783_c0_g1~~TRINITY_DN4783_c0_g1_i4.p1  ORF type:complete len:301 (+),score=84.27 TRINITY_DN4783_c0_g1_i4:36-938(+)
MASLFSRLVGAVMGEKKQEVKPEEPVPDEDEKMEEPVAEDKTEDVQDKPKGSTLKRKRDADDAHYTPEEFKQMWPVSEAPFIITTSTLEGVVVGDIGKEELDAIMEGINADIKEGLTVDFEWHAPLGTEEEDPASNILKVTGMSTPFSRMLFRKFLEKPASYRETLPDEAYTVLEDTVFVDYKDVETARRQKRRITGSVWPVGGNGATISASFISREKMESAVVARKEKGLEEEARLRQAVEAALKKAEEEANPPKLTLDDLFNKTTTTPRLYYNLHEDESVIKKARNHAEAELEKLLKS